MSRKVGLPTGPVLKVYSREHKQVKSLEEFVDGEKYICCGAEKFNLEACMQHLEIVFSFLIIFIKVPPGLSDEYDGETTPTPAGNEEGGAAHEEEERKPVVRSYSKGTPEKFGTQTEKGKIIMCFRNGDKHQTSGTSIRFYLLLSFLELT